MVSGLYIGLKIGFLLWGNNIPSAFNAFTTNHAVTVRWHLLLCTMKETEKHAWSKQSDDNRRIQKITERDIPQLVHLIRSC
jgi:hypothetical protein